jgi:hypothetical protein
MRNVLFRIFWLLCLFPFPVSTSLSHTPFKLHTVLKNYRGGQIDLKKIPSNEIITVWILSKFGGSHYLEKRIKLEMHKNSTIEMVKSLISKQFPGNPPTDLQNLFFGFDQVQNSQKLFEISNNKILPLQLDLISGTKSYQKVKSVREALEGYVSSQIHDIFLSQQALRLLSSAPHTLPSLTSDPSQKNQTALVNETEALVVLPQSIAFMEMFEKFNQSVFDSHGVAIQKALEDEQDPTPPVLEGLKDATTDGLGYETIDEYLEAQSSLRRFLTTEFSFNRQILRSLVLYSLVWIVSDTASPLPPALTPFLPRLTDYMKLRSRGLGG